MKLINGALGALSFKRVAVTSQVGDATTRKREKKGLGERMSSAFCKKK